MMSSYSSERASFHHDRKHKYVAIPAAPPSLGNHMFSFDSGCMHACMQAMDRESSEQFQEKERVRMELQTAWATCLFCYAFPQQPVGDGSLGWLVGRIPTRYLQVCGKSRKTDTFDPFWFVRFGR